MVPRNNRLKFRHTAVYYYYCCYCSSFCLIRLKLDVCTAVAHLYTPGEAAAGSCYRWCAWNDAKVHLVLCLLIHPHLMMHAGVEVLFVSEEAVFNGAKAIRGGIPLVFPQV